MCDRALRIKRKWKQISGRLSQEDELHAPRTDKNREYVTGQATKPKRARFQPNLGQMRRKEVKAWIIGRWIDEIMKSAHEEFGANLVTVGAMEMLTELHLLKHTTSELRRTIDSIRNPEVQWLMKIGRRWLERLRKCDGVERWIQDKMWELHKETGVSW